MIATAGLEPGDRVQQIVTPEDPAQVYRNVHYFHILCFVEETDREEEVFCATVDGIEAFALQHGIVTGNCPFCAEASKGEPDAVRRWEESPEDTAKGMLVEYNSLCFNPRGHLYRDRALQDVVHRIGVTAAQEAFERKLAEIPWALYEVRRIYTKKGKAMRHVRRIKSGTRTALLTYYGEHGSLVPGGVPFIHEPGEGPVYEPATRGEVLRGIFYAYFAEREPDVYPTREGYYVVAPAFMEDKLRGDPKKFNERWERVGKGLPMNPTAEEKAAAARTKQLAKENLARNEVT
jgi:hypothetical protein